MGGTKGRAHELSVKLCPGATSSRDRLPHGSAQPARPSGGLVCPPRPGPRRSAHPASQRRRAAAAPSMSCAARLPPGMYSMATISRRPCGRSCG